MVGLHDHTFYGGAQWPYVHQPVSAPRLYLASGVTTIRTTGSTAPYQDLIVKHSIDSGLVVGPRMYVTGPYITGPGGNDGVMHEVATPEAARRIAAYWAAEGASWLKVYNMISREELGALVEEAHRHGVKVTGHLCSIGYREAVALGMDAVEHGLYANSEYDPDKRPDQCPGVKMSVLEKLDLQGPAVQATFRDMVSHHVAMTSTLAIFEGLMSGRPPLEQRTLDALYPPAKDVYLKAREMLATPEARPYIVTDAGLVKLMAYEVAFVKAGGLLGAGVDPTGVGGVLAGFGDQRNYELFLEAGFTPVQAIQILSANGARILGAYDRFGSVTAGKLADLVVIKGDLVATPADIRNVTLVFREGVGYDSAQADRLGQGDGGPAMIRAAAGVALLTGLGACAAGRAADPGWCDHPSREGYASLERVAVPDPWFHVYRVDSAVYALYEAEQFQEVISYLILGSDRALLFDTGMGMRPIRPVVESLTRLPVTVVNSHTHYDHIGGNAEFADVRAMDTDFTRENERGNPHATVAGEVAGQAVCLTHLPGFDTAGYAIRAFRPSGRIADGDTLDLGGRTVEIVAVPGHTPDAIALLDRRNGLLWTGDTFYDGPIWLYFPGTDLDAYGRSIARLAALAPSLRRIFPAHNTPLAPPDRLPELVRRFQAVRAGQVRGEPRDGGLVEYRADGVPFSFLMRPVTPSS